MQVPPYLRLGRFWMYGLRASISPPICTQIEREMGVRFLNINLILNKVSASIELRSRTKLALITKLRRQV